MNLNSPTVQAMLNNIPQGIGNMPVYFGNDPSVSQFQQQATPYPSPKEMLIQGGQASVYSPTQFMPNNIVGGYNPGYQAAFNSYSNPYLNYNYQFYYPMDEDSRDRLEAANNNGLTYDEQLENESNLFKTLSGIVSKNVGRSKEDAEKCAESFSIYCKHPTEDLNQYKAIKPMHIQLKEGDDVVADMTPETTTIRTQDYRRNIMYVDQMKSRQVMIDHARVANINSMYDRAPERMFDKMDMLDFFNNGAGVIIADSLNRELHMQNISRTGQLYDRDGFKQRLLENNGLKSKTQQKAVERFVGRYGMMPNGTPVSPGHDPAISSSFSYDATTGQYNVVAPNFIRDRLERARESFIRSIDG